MVHWSDSFWGDGNRGLEILSSNIKNGAIAIEEFQRFLTESAQCESAYSKNLSRLQSQFIKIQHVGTFTPIWNLIRDLLDKISSTHLLTVNFYQDLLRDIHIYQELYPKKVKAHIQKDSDIIRTADLITQLNNALNTVNKAKEQYHSIAIDYERSKRQGHNNSNPTATSTSQDSNSGNIAQTAFHSLSLRNNERLERKYRQAQDEYKSTIEKYNSIRNDYEKRFSDASAKFQAFEIDHIEKMLAFSLNYSDILQRTDGQIRQAQTEFNDKLKLLTGQDLLDAFVEQKKTGIDRPTVLQFEEVDNLKSSIQLSDLPSTNQDDSNLTNQFETGLPSFQAHFSVQPSPTKHTDNNRALGAHSPYNESAMSPTSVTSTSISPMNSLTRSQEGNSGGEPTSNPFDLKIKKPKFPGFFITNRKDKDKKEKKNDKKPTVNTKLNKLPSKQHSRDELHGNNLQNSTFDSNDFRIMTDNNDDYVQISSNNTKTKRSTPEPYGESSPSISNDDMNYPNRIQLRSSKASKSTSSSDTSDDDNDNLMTKIYVKINETKPQILADEDDETKISNAMRLVDKNLGNFASNSRGLSNRTPDLNKSISIGQIGNRPLPPPPTSVVSRSALTIQNSIAANNVDHSNMFPSQDEFAQIPFNSLNINQENRSIPSQSTSESKNTTSISSNDDDTEVANSFPINDLTNKSTPFPILQVPSLFLSNRQSLTNSMSPSITSIQQNSNNSPINSNELGISPLTIGAMDQIPLAIAFQETIHVIMFGDIQENWKSRIVGQMLISFPSSLLNILMDRSRTTNPLEFRLKNLDNIENIMAKPSLITQNETPTDSDELNYTFDMTELNNTLRNLQENNPSSPFFNLNVLNYELKQLNVSNIPIEISSQWSRTFDTISVNIKYRFNSSILPETIRFTNNSVIFYTIITDGLQMKESSPIGEWSATEHKLWWKIPYINNGTGSLSATIMTMQTDIENDDEPLTTSSIIKAYFVGENALFSSIDFDLPGRNYRISLLKKKILSGKYQSEPDQSEPIQLFRRPTKSPSSNTQ